MKKRLGPKALLHLFKTAAVDWMNDHAPRLGAALAFYTIFSLAPLITITVSIAALWFSDNASQEIFKEIGAVIGQDNAKSLEGMLVQEGKEGQGWFAAIASGAVLLFGATGVFVQLQDSLNQIWEVKPKAGQGIMGFVRHRLISFAMVLGIAFLLLVSLLLTAGLAAVGRYFSHLVGDSGPILQILNTLLSFCVVSLLFALMFKYVPDAEVSWKDVWVGALATALLFTLGKFALGIYLGKSSVASTYSVAGALIVTLLWVYYTAQIVFFGAELTQAYAHHFGRGVTPSAHAELDPAARCINETASADRAAKAGKKVKPSAPAPVTQPALHPAYSAAALAAPAAAGVAMAPRKHSLGKLLGGAVLLAMAFVPLERRFFGRAKA
jgi:membrane protein